MTVHNTPSTAGQPGPSACVSGCDIWIDGTGPSTVLMLHGWPDTHRLWDATVAALQDRHRCVRFTLPGFDPALPPRPTSVADMTALIAAVADAVSPDQPVTLLQHDWGCVFGYEYAMRHPGRVARIVAVDIGDHNSGALARALPVKAKLMVLAYQVWLALAWQIGRLSAGLGNRMTRWMARAMRCPAPPQQVSWMMNYPYAMAWFGLKGGLRGLAPVRPACPVLYFYGKRKPFQFQSPAWLERLAARAGSAVVPMRTGHWVMLDQPDDFHHRVGAWLDQAA
jgi:pimeloyl-ACP methyl ester carboxylesterase